jgi:hypothetical protein
MQHKLSAFIMIFIAIILASCEKVIDVQLNDSAKKYVIEGVVTDQDGNSQVKISQTKNFSDNNDFEGVRGASVIITEEDGKTTHLNEATPGIYIVDLGGEPGNQYKLDVIIDGKVYSAISQMPARVAMDSIYISEMDMGSETDKMVNVVYNDPAGLGNAYRFVLYINGKKVNTIFERNDDLSDGRKTTVTLMDHDTDLKKGDTVKVEMQCIDVNVYKYWFSLSQGATGDGQSASPANPVTNISGGALGYFSAHTVREKTIVIP